jgi:2-amino-4-hydroxy-6-hydroxymethyldihydropteridine diphosphokinase|tara:strand:- start:998 stop:1498 length:501 start_codon:yes stop_codon:yes gene_type:complete
MSERVYIAMGSNIGDRFAHLAFAFRELSKIALNYAVEFSSIYETEAIGPGVQKNYYNAVVSLETSWAPERLLEHCLEIEMQRGRERRERWGPRTLDLDLLFHGDRTHASSTLTLPHPRIQERAFVLAPLCELEPRLLIQRKAITQHLSCLDAEMTSVRRLDDLNLG